MSAYFRKPRPDPANAAEPLLADLLDDPVLRILMDRDHVDRALLDRLIREARTRLGAEAPVLALPPAVPDVIFATCAG